jgi:HD-GYP domain-containing protein (c-di-GMP phosphodiesterase class II)
MSVTTSHTLISFLEDNSLSILREATQDVRANAGPTLQAASDDELQVALYTVLLKILDSLRERAGAPAEHLPDVRALFLKHAKAMMEHIDSQSAYTADHTTRVVSHVVKIASLMGMSDHDIDEIEYAAWIHNLGLINQSQKLAMLPRALSQDELKAARNHTVVGAEMIRPIEFLSNLVPVVRYHHTRYDGNGAEGLQGDAIPIGARIIMLADAYQAMLEPRAYRPALSRRDALTEINKGAGTQFDPALVQYAHELT